MIELYKHQREAVQFLVARRGAGLFHTMGVGKTRSSLFAARQLFDERKIDRVLVLCPMTVAISWREELTKLGLDGFNYTILAYDPKKQVFKVESIGGDPNAKPNDRMTIALVSYGLLPQDRHKNAIRRYAIEGQCILICDESSALKNRTAKQTQAAYEIARDCQYRWLLSGTPVCNSPLDLYAQGKVMSPTGGPLAGYKNFYHFRGAYGTMGGFKMKQWTADNSRLPELTKRFAPYVSRVEKKDCLDLPEKSYTVREIALSEETWKIYCELKRDCLLALPNTDARPEPNAVVRILRLCQITSGHVGVVDADMDESGNGMPLKMMGVQDVSDEKLSWITEQIVSGELEAERAIIVWTRWRRERERLVAMLPNIAVTQIYGGQSPKEREMHIKEFMSGSPRKIVMLAQPHSGGFGLTLTAAHTAVYLSNDFSYSTRVQSEDRCHRIGQTNPVLYIDVVAVGPKGQPTIDAHILEALRSKRSVAEFTCSQWKRVLA